MTEHNSPWRLQDAIAAARSGQREQAQLMLHRIVADEPANVDAWLWLGGVEVDPAAQYRALERVVALDPSNERAAQGLYWLDKQYPNLSITPVPTDGTADSVTTLPLDTSVGDSVATDDVFLTDEPTIPRGADPELRCPYCGEWTNISDTACTRCQYPLIVDAGRSIGAGITRWFLSLVWLLIAVAAGVVAWWALGEAPRIQEGASKIGLSIVALGGSAPLGNAVPLAMLSQLANGTIVAASVLTILGILFVLGMLFRWRAIFVLQIITLLLLIASTGALIAVLWNGGRLELDAVNGFNADVIVLWALAPALIGFVVMLLLTIAARREFFPRRVRVRIPDEPMPARAHFKRGKLYQGRGWLWASARELERAVEQKPQDRRYNRALADVYTLMGDDAEETGELIKHDANEQAVLPDVHDTQGVSGSEQRER